MNGQIVKQKLNYQAKYLIDIACFDCHPGLQDHSQEEGS